MSAIHDTIDFGNKFEFKMRNQFVCSIAAAIYMIPQLSVCIDIENAANSFALAESGMFDFITHDFFSKFRVFHR